MRDWLAFPINTNAGGNSASSSSSVKNNTSSDEGITTDEDEYRYDIIHESASTEDELEVIECNNESQNEELSTWLSILNVFGVAKKIKNKTSSSSLSSSSTSSLSIKKSREIIPKPEIDLSINESFNDESIQEEEESHDDFEEEEESHDGFEEEEEESHDGFEEEEETTHLQRTLSSSSIASSTDTDNSTPASSQIMRSSSTPSKYYHAMTMSKTTNVKICWNHGGKKVQVTGEFDNWSVSVDMAKDTEKSGCHVVDIPMDLSKDIEFKFIVDGEWRYANDLPHRTDWRGNINNVVYKKEKHLVTTLVNQ